MDDLIRRQMAIDADKLLERAIPHGWSTPLWVSDIVIEDAPTIDAVEVVRCRDCIHRPEGTGANHDLKFPDEVCPCQCVDDFWYSWKPNEDWFCASGERG